MPIPAKAPDPVVDAARDGDGDARRELLERHGPMVWGLCRRLSRDPEDAYQEIWEKVLRNLDRFDPSRGSPLRAWIATIAHRHLVDLHRRRAVRGEVVPLDAAPGRSPRQERTLSLKQRIEHLELALQRLPLAQRRVVVFHHLEGRSLEAIAQTEGIAVGTVKSRLHRARGRLAELMEGSR